MYSPENPELFPCTEDDVPMIVAASLHLLEEVQREKTLDLSVLGTLLVRETLRELPEYLKIIRSGQIMGWVHLVTAWDHLELDDLNIKPEFQNQGLGSWLLDQVKARAREAGLPIRCTVQADNEAALRFYRRHGFVIQEGPASPGLILQWLSEVVDPSVEC